MAKPQINTGAYGDGRSAAAAAGAKEAALGAEADFDKGTKRGQVRRESEAKVEAADLKAQNTRTILADKERTYRKSHTIDPLAIARQSAETQEQFKNIGSELFPLKKKQRLGTITEDESAKLVMYENTIESFMAINKAETESVAAYNVVGDSVGYDEVSSPENRLKALALADKKLKLVQVDGEWRYQGEYEDIAGNMVKVDDSAVDFLDNLNLTAKTDWDTTNANTVANIPLKTTRTTSSDGSQYDNYTYDKAAVLQAATSDLSTPDKLDSYAFNYLTNVKGLSDEEARAQVEDYGVDGYGKFKTELIDHHTQELITEADKRTSRVQTKAGTPEFSKPEISKFSSRTTAVKEAFKPGSTLSDISASINGLNGAFESAVDGDNLVITQYNPVTGKATSQKIFNKSQLGEAQNLINKNHLGEKGVYYQSTLPPEVETKVIPLEDKYGAPTGPIITGSGTEIPGTPIIPGETPANSASKETTVLEDPATSTNPRRAKKQFQQKYGITYSNHQKLDKLTDTKKNQMQTLFTEYKGLTASLEGVGRDTKRGKQIIARRNELKEEASTLTGLGFSGYGFSGDGAFSTIDQYNKAGEIEAYGAPKATGPTPQAKAKTAIENFRTEFGVSFDVKTNKKLNKVLQALGEDWLDNIPTSLQTTVATQKQIIEDAYNNLNK